MKHELTECLDVLAIAHSPLTVVSGQTGAYRCSVEMWPDGRCFTVAFKNAKGDDANISMLLAEADEPSHMLGLLTNAVLTQGVTPKASA